MENVSAIKLLQNKAEQLGRIPKKSDFKSDEICLIKAKLGPWNRALESAGLKEVSKHYIAKREKVQAKRKLKKENKQKLKGSF